MAMENRVVLFRYKGYELIKGVSDYYCVVGDSVERFDNAGKWKRFVDEREKTCDCGGH